jgi:phosphoglycerate dehydrogenase-like enzyme
MKATAFLINTARGGIVDEEALFEVLQNRQIAGAAVDVFAVEPVVTDHPFSKLDNVLLAPHSIAWTDEIFHDIGEMASRMTQTLAEGKIPSGVINREVLQRPKFQTKLRRFQKEASHQLN